MTTHPRIFISYARADGADAALALSRRLTDDHQLPVWRDRAEIEGGRSWWRQIREAIDGSEYLILILTRGALQSHIVTDEIRYARRQGVCVVPVIGDRTIDIAQLPEWMRSTHLVDVDDRDQWARFVRTLESPGRTLRVPMMAERPPDDFVHRPQEFEALRTLLVDKLRGLSVAITAAFKGAGGYGKTTLARALCHDESVQELFYDGILWITLGEQPGDPAAKLEDLVVSLTGAPSGVTSVEARKNRLADLLTDRRVLLVIDDVWSERHLQPFLVGGRRCVRLITTRDSQVLPADTIEVRVDAMTGGEATALLKSGLPPSDDRSYDTLAGRLGEWPLLLKLVNGILRDRVNRLHDSVSGALNHATRLLDRRGLTAFDARDPLQRQHAVSITLDASIGRLERNEQQRLRELAVFPEDVAVPLDTVACLWAHASGLHADEVEDLLQTLWTLSLLLDLNLESRRIRIHDVVRSYLSAKFEREELAALHGQLIAAYRARHPDGWTSDHDDDYLYRFLLFHLAASGATSELRDLLIDPGWIEAKLRHTDLATILADFAAWARDPTTNRIGQALRLSDILEKDADAVLPQLLGRIGAQDSQELAELAASWRNQARPRAWLCPETPSLGQPGHRLVQTIRCGLFRGDRRRLCIADDGSCFAVCNGSDVEIYELTSGQRRARISGGAWVTGGFTQDGLLALGSYDRLIVFDLRTHREVRTLTCPNEQVFAVAVTPGGDWIAALARSEDAVAVHLWDVRVGNEVLTLERRDILDFVITSDGRHIVIGLPAGILEVWSVAARRLVTRWECHEIDVRTLENGTSPDEVIAVSAGGTVQRWRIGAAWGETIFTGRHTESSAVAVAGDGGAVAVGYPDGLVELWRTVDGHPRLTSLRAQWASDPYGHDASVIGLAVTPDGRWVISAAEDGSVRVWSGARATLSGDDATLAGMCLAMTPDGCRVIARDAGGSISVRETESGRAIATLEDAGSCYVRLSPDGRWAIGERRDGSVAVWNANTGQRMAVAADASCRCAITVANRIVYVPKEFRQTLCAKDLLVEGARPESSIGPFARDADKWFGRVTAIPGTNRVVASLANEGILIWEDGSKTANTISLEAPIDISDWNVSPDGRLLTGVSYNQTAIWELATGDVLFKVESEGYVETRAAVLTPQNRRLIVADGRAVKVYDVERGSVEAIFYADAPVAAVGSSSETQFVAASLDGHLHRLVLRIPNDRPAP